MHFVLSKHALSSFVRISRLPKPALSKRNTIYDQKKNEPLLQIFSSHFFLGDFKKTISSPPLKKIPAADLKSDARLIIEEKKAHSFVLKPLLSHIRDFGFIFSKLRRAGGGGIRVLRGFFRLFSIVLRFAPSARGRSAPCPEGRRRLK